MRLFSHEKLLKDDNILKSLMSKLVKVKIEHSAVFRILFDVLKDVIHEFKMDFIKDTIKKSDEKSNDSSDKDNEDSSDSDSDSDSSNSNKKTSKKKSHKSKKNKSNSEQDDNNESKQIEKKAGTAGGIRILELDEHQTLLIYVKLNSDKFDDFYVKYPIYSIGLDLIQLHKFLKTIDKDSILSIYVDKDDEQNIVFQTKNDIKPSTSTYTQKVLDLDDVDKRLPKQTNFEILVTIETTDLHKLCREMHQWSDYVEITCTSKEITFKCQGDSSSFVKKFTNADKSVRIMCLNNNTKKPVIVQAIFELKYLVTFGKCVNLCPEMQLYLRNDYPIFIHYSIAEIGKMLVGITPVDQKAIKKDNDYDESHDKYYENNKKVVLKTK